MIHLALLALAALFLFGCAVALLGAVCRAFEGVSLRGLKLTRGEWRGLKLEFLVCALFWCCMAWLAH